MEDAGRETEKQRARLVRWRQEGDTLLGIVFDHPKLEDGTYVRTTPLVNIDLENHTAETQNTLYTLGAPAPPIPVE